MKKLWNTFLICAFAICPTLLAQKTSSQGLITIYGNDHFEVRQNVNEFKISINKEPDESFAIQLKPSDFAQRSLSLAISSDKMASIRICYLENQRGSIKETTLKNENLDKKLNRFDFDFNQDEFSKLDQITLIVHIEQCYPWSGVIFLKVLENKNELDKESSITLFPNPANEIITIQSNNFDIDHYQIINESGLICLQGNKISRNSSIKINTSSLISGTYKLVGFYNQEMTSSKFTIKHK